MELEIRYAKREDIKKSNVFKICNLINSVYNTSEKGMWREGSLRISFEETLTRLKESRMILAITDNSYIGSLNIDVVDQDVVEISCLVCDPDFRGHKVGKSLIQKSEDWGRDQDFKTIRLEVLAPKNFLQPDKVFLEKYYLDLDYKKVRVEKFEKFYQQASTNLKVPCVFDVWEKRL